MSEVEHIKGKLKPTGKTINEFIGDVEFETWQSNAREYFEDEYYGSAFEIDGKVFLITERKEVDTSNDIFESNLNKDGTIDFEVKYYNGGCGLNEALAHATKKS